jgi:hypothetical protein
MTHGPRGPNCPRTGCGLRALIGYRGATLRHACPGPRPSAGPDPVDRRRSAGTPRSEAGQVGQAAQSQGQGRRAPSPDPDRRRGAPSNAALTGQAGGNARESEIYGDRLDGIEAEVAALKDKIFRSKARLAVLRDTVLSGVMAGGRVIVAHRNLMGSAFAWSAWS